MSTNVTDEQIRDLAATAKPYSLVVLQWGPERYMHGAEAIELEHQRRMVSMRADGVIAILCPIASATLAGMAIMTVSTQEARERMDADPCVRAGMMHYEVYESQLPRGCSASMNDWPRRPRSRRPAVVDEPAYPRVPDEDRHHQGAELLGELGYALTARCTA